VEPSDFERMYEQHAGAIAAYALRRTRSEPDAEEIVAETFLIAWRRGGELRGEPLPWLYGVAEKQFTAGYQEAQRLHCGGVG
jgi:RNA polymerase sigma-70 factor, ECF subfamily